MNIRSNIVKCSVKNLRNWFAYRRKIVKISVVKPPHQQAIKSESERNYTKLENTVNFTQEQNNDLQYHQNQHKSLYNNLSNCFWNINNNNAGLCYIPMTPQFQILNIYQRNSNQIGPNFFFAYPKSV